jgi:2-iminobutanoate/2-iminopropanoate deaminase
MSTIRPLLSALILCAACTVHAEVRHFPAQVPASSPLKGSAPPFSAAVLANDTLYISGTLDMDPETGKIAATPEEGAKIVLDSIRKTVEAAGFTMNNLVWVQVFCSDLANFPIFNKAYVTYFKGPLPARAFLGVDHLLANAHYEVMGIAVRSR